MGRNILMVGTFPPPLHGMSAVNLSLYNHLTAKGWTVKKIDTAPTTLKRDLLSRLTRLKKLFIAWHYILRTNTNHEIFYISLSGGWGQIYDLVSLFLARLKKYPCVLHHHSYAYLIKRSALTTLLIQIAGKKAIHVVLSTKMRCIFQNLYGLTNNTVVLSNLAFYHFDCHFRTRTSVQKIGFLSNITKSKGGETVIQLAYDIKKKRIPIDIVLAGPCSEEDLEYKLQNAMLASKLDWLGSVYGDQKKSFFTDIDVFIFPTQYENEAEPLVIWEALAAGIPVISYQRGSIGEQVGKAGVLIPIEEDFIPYALNIFDRWVANPDEYIRYVQHAQEHYIFQKSQSEQQWQNLGNVLMSLDHNE